MSKELTIAYKAGAEQIWPLSLLTLPYANAGREDRVSYVEHYCQSFLITASEAVKMVNVK